MTPAARVIRDKLAAGIRAYEAGLVTFRELRAIGQECADSTRAAGRGEVQPCSG